MLRTCVFLRLPYISAAQLRLGACAEGHIDRAVCDKKVSQMSSSAPWQQLVRESPDFSSFSIEREETRLGRVYIIGVSVAPSTTWQYVIPPNISIRTLGWLRLLPSLFGLLFTFVGHKHVFLQEPFQDFCQFHCPFHREEV